jgi:DNA replication and repair protein RecF
MVTFNKPTATVHTTAIKKFGDINISIKLGGGTKKAISINGVPISKVGELMGNIPCVFFSPDELRLIKDAPADRRRFLNIDISQIDKSYFYALVRYNKILLQRNAYLKNLPCPPTADELRGLSIWDTQLVAIGTVLIQRRIEFVRSLLPHLTKVHNYLTKNTENITFQYVFCGSEGTEQILSTLANPIANTTADITATDPTTDPSPTDPTTDPSPTVAEYFARQLLSARERDIRLRTTTVGPHRDDIKIEINGKDVRVFGSQGQQRTTALSIKLAELQLFADITGEKPILLLDDVFSELDSSRQGRLLTFINSTQTIITTTEILPATFRNKIKVINIANGKIV